MTGLRTILAGVAFILVCALAAGCGPAVGGPRFWWDDQNHKALDNYSLPPVGELAAGSAAAAGGNEGQREQPAAGGGKRKTSSAGVVPQAVR